MEGYSIMSKENFDIKVIKLLQDFFHMELKNTVRDSLLPEMDSITFIELVVLTETTFDIELYDEELLYNSEITVQNWIDIVEKHLSCESSEEETVNYLLMD